MRWKEEAVVLHLRPYGESSAIATVMSEKQGICSGLVRSIRTMRVIFTEGNLIQAEWHGRLATQLGTLTGEMIQGFGGRCYLFPAKLLAIASFSALYRNTMFSHEPFPEIYRKTIEFLYLLQENPFLTWIKTYTQLELLILKAIGFGLTLEKCSVTGTTENVIYVSPHTGRAVCESIGQPYAPRLLPLPPYLRIPHVTPSLEEILQSLNLTAFFFEKHYGGKLPPPSQRLREHVKQQANERKDSPF